MKYVYFDHNIVIQVAESGDTKAREALDKIQEAKEITVAASLWNLAEAAGGNQKEQSLKLGSFFDELQPAWLTDRLALQRQEVRQFVYHNYFGVKVSTIHAFEQHLSQLVAHLGQPDLITVGETAEKFIDSLLASSDAVNTIRQAYRDTPAVLRALQDAKKKKALTKELREQIFRDWMKTLVPSRDPEKRAIDEKTYNQLVECCKEKEILETCKAVAVEHYLSDFRISDPNRKPEEQDAPDLAHAVQALAYCDVFVTREGYLNSAAQYVTKHCPLGIAETVDSVESALGRLLKRHSAKE